MAVGMQRALDSAIGLPSRSTSALRMLVFLMPAEVSRNFMMPLLVDLMGAERPSSLSSYDAIIQRAAQRSESPAQEGLRERVRAESSSSFALSPPRPVHAVVGCVLALEDSAPHRFVPFET